MVNKWIFPLNRKLNIEERLIIEKNINEQLSDWNSHGKPIEFKVEILFHQVIVIEALTSTSGCSIDSLQKKIRDLLASYQLEILDNHYVMYLNNNDLSYFDFRDTENQIKNQILNEETQILDTQKILEGNENPLSVLRDTWLVRYC